VTNLLIMSIVVWGLLALLALHALILDLWCRRWGTTPAERERHLSGDAWIRRPNYEATLAVTINAPPDCIWPWLVQIGYQRGGLYSYDWLDRWFGYLDRPSADRVLPEFQHLDVGDVIPIGRGFGFPVCAMTRNRTLLLAADAEEMRWTWQFLLEPIDSEHTRLISRNRASASRALATDVFMALLEPAAFIMTRRMLLGIKARAERLAKDHADPSSGSIHAAA
jgi:hypothetical protein